jgi:acyl-CoA thioesterase FadM
VSASLDYHRPLRFEEEFDVSVRVAAITDKAIRYDCLLTRGDEKIASGSLAIVCVRRQADGTMKAASIPAHIASRFRVDDRSDRSRETHD